MNASDHRELDWSTRSAAAFDAASFVEELADALAERGAPDGGAVLLVEVAGESGEALLGLVEGLCELWQSRHHSSVVLDCHPAAPFTAGLFAGEPEGFTEMLHYGVSPHKLARLRRGVCGHWIPAGGPWSLPPEAIGEPQRSVRRLAQIADRVVLLASAGNEEGLLDALRESADYRLVLRGAAGAELAAGEPAAGAAPGNASGAPEAAPRAAAPEPATPAEFSLDQRRSRLSLLFWILPVLLIGAVIWWWSQGMLSPKTTPSGVLVARQTSSPLTHLPAAEKLPFTGEVAPSDSASGEGGSPALVPSGDEDAREEAGREAELSPRGEDLLVTPPVAAPSPAPRNGAPAAPADTEAAASPPARDSAAETAESPRRRFESRERWRSVLDHSGPFLVHVESYRDSSLGAASARRSGYDRVGFELIPVRVRDVLWYRLCVGPFPDLHSAVAYRDSLLDEAGVDYCVIQLDHAD